MPEDYTDSNISLVLILIGLCSIGWYLWRGDSSQSAVGNRIASAQKNDNVDIENVVAELKNSNNKLWKDPSFGHDAFPGPSIGYTLQLRDGERGKPLKLGRDSVTWQPPSKFSASSRPLGVRGDGVPTWLYSDNDGDGVVSAAESMNVSDIQQGSVGNCYFLSALASLVQCHPDLCDDLIDETYEDEYGIYGVSFWRRGKWRMTYVDSYFPCYRPSSKSHRGKYRLIFTNPTDRKEIWPMVVEKAFAKLAGSYEAISGGHISEALELLTGGRGRRSSPKKSQWNDLKHQVQSDEYLVGAGSQQEESDPVQAAEQKKTLNGIVTGHAYTIVNVYDDDDNGLRLVELRNPWGRGEWKGDWGSGSSKWDSEEGRKVVAQVGSPPPSGKGRFWMSYPDFCDCFTTIDSCQMNFTAEDRARREELRKEAAKIIKNRPQKQNNNSSGGGGGGQEYTQESADAMMELLLAEEAAEKRKNHVGARGNKRKTGSRKKGRN